KNEVQIIFRCKSMRNTIKKLIYILSILVIMMFVIFIPTQRRLVFYQELIDQIAAYLPLKKEQSFQIIFTHSIHLTDVVEKYEITNNNDILQNEIVYEEFGIGMPSNAEEGQDFEYEDGKYHIKNLNNVFPEMNIRNGKTVSEHRLLWGDADDMQHKVLFNDFFEPGGWFKVSIQNYHYLRLGKRLKFMTSKEQKDKKTDPSQANREEETNLSKDKDVQNHNEEVDEVEVDSSNNEAESSISDEEQEELLKTYDAESNTRDVKGIVAGILFVLMLAFSLFQIYTGIFGEYTAYIQRTVHLGFALSLVFFLFPINKKIRKSSLPWYDIILILLSIAVCAYLPLYYDELVQQIGTITDVQLLIGGIGILLVLEASRRAVGLPITVIASLFLAYAYFGPSMPGMFAHRGLTIHQLVDAMFFTTEGILGTPLQVSSTYIFLFLLFGAFLVQTGVGNYFNDLAIGIAGKRTGGPAKVAIFSSALNGTISGSSVANTVTTGSYTIPMMKR